MSISILNRGASGGLKPELTVIAPSGSTIDLLQNGTVVKTYALGADETEHTFVVKVGTYTVRGTLGEQNKSVEAVIDAVGQYAVEIDYYTYLYNLGDECEDLTGGWNAVALKFSSSTSAVAPTVTRNDDSLVGYMGSTSSGGILRCANAIDLTNVEKLCFTGAFEFGKGMAIAYMRLCVWSSIGSTVDDNLVASLWADPAGGIVSAVTTFNLDNAELNVSTLSGNHVIGFCYYGQNGSTKGNYCRSTMNVLKMA